MAKGKVVNLKAVKKEKKRREKNQALAQKQQLKKQKRQQQNKSKAALNPKERETAIKRRLISIIIVIILLIAGGYSVYKIAVLHVEKHQLNEQNINLKREKNLLEDELKNIQDLEYVEEEAREKLNLIMPGEIIYKFSHDEDGK